MNAYATEGYAVSLDWSDPEDKVRLVDELAVSVFEHAA